MEPAMRPACLTIISEDLYYVKQAPDLYVVMEHVTSHEQARRWTVALEVMDLGYLGTDFTKPDLEEEIAKYEKVYTELKESGCIADEVLNHRVRAGAGNAGPQTVRKAEETFDSINPTELWIGYVWNSPEPPSGPFEMEDFMKLEMSMTVTTRAPFIYTWHMGITRNRLWRFVPDIIMHKGVSPFLHGFAAYIMNRQHPELHYVMTNPEPTMYDILLKTFEDEVGETVFGNWRGTIAKAPSTFRFTTLPDEYGETKVVCEVLMKDIAQLQKNPSFDFSKHRMDEVKHDRIDVYSFPDLEGGRKLIWSGTEAEFKWPRFEGLTIKQFVADIRTVAGAIPIAVGEECQ